MAELEVKGNLLGFIGLQEDAAEFNLEINKLSYDRFTLAQPGWKMHAAFKEDVRVITENTGIFSLDGIKTIISPFQAYIDNKSISLTSGEFSLDTFLHSRVEGKIDRDSGQGRMKLFDVSLQFDSVGSLFFHEEEISTNIYLTKSNLSFIFPNYQTTLNIFNDKKWNVFCDAVHLLTPFSSLLQKFNIAEGHFLFGSKNGGSPFVFDGTLISPYQFLVEDGVESGVFSIKGEIDNNRFSGIINEKTHISLSDIIQIHSKETGFNLP
ncbi:MAG: hypothetical protein GY705_26800, partial [Bacteroidetes bacterium]|nr:hypothetical protein [Bacteroidota bacterium]